MTAAGQKIIDGLNDAIEHGRYLRNYGYASGSYVCTCCDCGKRHTADKRAWRCRACAWEAFLDNATSETQ